MTFPVFASGDVLNASDMNAVGLWLVKSQAVGTGVASVTVTGAFSADYENYRIIIDDVVFSSTGISWGLQIGGASSNYYGSSYYDLYTGGQTGTLRTNNGSFLYFGVSDNNNATAVMDVISPYSAKITNFVGNFYGSGYSGWACGSHAVASAQTSFTLYTPFGTMTGGTIRVYGYRN